MASETNEGDELTALLERFADAWNRHDCESLLSMVTEDCEFRTAAGPTAAGSIFVGKAQLREAFPLAWMTYPDASWNEARHFVFGCRGVSQWTFRGSNARGETVEVDGVDLLEFRDGLISRKDTYRKMRA